MTQEKIVAIHQPNFLPWLGFFDKWAKADILVLLDDVQFPKTGGVWTNRCRIVEQGSAKWLTLPIDRSFSGTKKINEILLLKDDKWFNKFEQRLLHSYGKHAFFEEVMNRILLVIKSSERSLFKLNLELLNELGRILSLDSGKLTLSSTIKSAGQSTVLLSSLVTNVGGSIYLEGGGARGYQQDDIFKENGIQVIKQNFTENPYQQLGVGGFIPGCSVIDVILNIGTAKTIELLKSSMRSN